MTDTHDGQPEPAAEADLFIDFANTLHFHDGEPEDRLADADALRAWLAQRALAGTDTPLSRVDRAIPAFRELRKRPLFRNFY